jgi:hypothetical protein
VGYLGARRQTAPDLHCVSDEHVRVNVFRYESDTFDFDFDLRDLVTQSALAIDVARPRDGFIWVGEELSGE